MMCGLKRPIKSTMRNKEHIKIVLLLLISFSCATAREAWAETTPLFASGTYEGLALAVGSDGKVTGMYREVQGEGVEKTCAFYLIGRVTGQEIKVATWSDRVLEGTLKAVKGGVELKIPRGREHTGCGLVLLPEIAEGIRLDLVRQTQWQELRKVGIKRVRIYAEPGKRPLKRLLVKGDVVGVTVKDKEGKWLQVEEVGGKPAGGWIRDGDSKSFASPK